MELGEYFLKLAAYISKQKEDIELDHKRAYAWAFANRYVKATKQQGKKQVYVLKDLGDVFPELKKSEPLSDFEEDLIEINKQLMKGG